MNRLILIALGIAFSAHAQSFTANPVAACAQLAQAQNVNILVIAAEGRGEYDEAHANGIFNYVNQRKSTFLTSALPQLQKTGILTDGLLYPLAHDFGDRINIVSMDLESTDPQPFNQAMACAKSWMDAKNEHKLILIGHSHGASRVANMAIMLSEQGIDVDTLITIDGLPGDGGTITRPPNAGTFLNFYQTKGAGDPTKFEIPGFSIYRGQSIPTADTNQEVTDVAGHFTITASVTVINAVKARFEKLLGPAQVASN